MTGEGLSDGDRLALRELVERYAQAVDRADGAGVAALFTDDGVLALWMDPASTAPTGERVGREEIATAVGGIARYAATHHTISSHTVSNNTVSDNTATVDAATATGETLCTAHHLSADGGQRHDRVLYLRYLDTFSREGGAWAFRRREVHVQWVSTLPVDD